jgi:D-cysteine desulfhydrase
LRCTCLLSHQPVQPGIGRKLLVHQEAGTEIVRFGGARPARVAIQRRCLQGRGVALLPMGGSNWIGTLGFVNAGLELAEQVRDGTFEPPSTVYVATGTLGTAAGIALGLALAGLHTEVRAIRVTDPRIANAAALRRLLRKTDELMRRADGSVPPDLADRAHLILRDDFCGEGYGRTDARTEAAIAVAAAELGLTLDSTYSGKALAALLSDLSAGRAGRPLFWNTANAVPLDIPQNSRPDFARLPAEFARYFAEGVSV